MVSVTSYTAERMQEIEDSAIIDGNVVGDNLILSRFDGGTIDAGNVRGATGPSPTNIAYGILGSSESVVSESSITTVQDFGDAVTVTVGSGRKIKITGQATIYTTGTNDHYIGYIKEGSSIVGVWCDTTLFSGLSSKHNGFIVLSPSAGPHTYKLTLERTFGTGNANSIPSSYDPILILVEDIGAA